MIFVDSSVWIDYFNGIETQETDLLDQKLSKELIVIGDLILTEVLQGFSKDSDFIQAQEFLSNLNLVHLGGKEMAIQCAQNYRFLRKKGITVRKKIDVLIGTFCIEKNIPIIHSDKDFDHIEEHLGLVVVKG